MKKSNHVTRVLESRKKGKVLNFAPVASSNLFPDAKIDPMLESQFAAGRLYASISSRPGQSGRGDGYVLEGKELEVGLTAHSQRPLLTSSFSSTSGRSERASRNMRTLHKSASFFSMGHENLHSLYVSNNCMGLCFYFLSMPAAVSHTVE